MQGDKHENSMKIEYSARLVVPAHEMAFSEGDGDRGAIDRGAIDRGAIMDRRRGAGVLYPNSKMLACYLLSLAGEACCCWCRHTRLLGSSK